MAYLSLQELSENIGQDAAILEVCDLRLRVESDLAIEGDA